MSDFVWALLVFGSPPASNTLGNVPREMRPCLSIPRSPSTSSLPFPFSFMLCSFKIMTKLEESALWFSDCNKIVIVKGADDCLHCYWMAEAPEADHSF